MLVEVAPWYAHIANYLVIGKVPKDNHESIAIGFLLAITFPKMATPCARVVIDVRGLGS
ncbi:hypothetical protein CK203_065945 [Vitis vinifera]|uniref:Uncharacterized protein n=1 Tax=Vitis vinifera TaxID=29760 RepID=A0A438FXF9_VITVI|nr:hypothetical protein CK203_065945 [Vitis vinifera]